MTDATKITLWLAKQAIEDSGILDSDIPRERIRFIGNSSLAGARLALLSTEAFRKADMIAKQMTYFELSVHPEFMKEFVASLFLPHTQMELFPSVQKSLARRRKHASKNFT